MKTPETIKIKIDESKKNIVLIGDNYSLMDIIEIYLYKDYNIVSASNEFDGIKNINHFSPICIFLKIQEDIDSLLSFMKKVKKKHLENVPVIAFTGKNISTIDMFKIKKVGVNEIIKFPIERREFMIVVDSVL